MGGIFNNVAEYGDGHGSGEVDGRGLWVGRCLLDGNNHGASLKCLKEVVLSLCGSFYLKKLST